MQFKQYPALAIVVSLTAATNAARAEAPAFRGAEGFAAEIDGGRGGPVIKVTTLAPSGPGSLKAALDTPGPRVVVFEVSGVIEAKELVIPHGDLTIAGQTAPGGGITIAGRLWAEYDGDVDDVVIRHVRIRPAPDSSISGEQFDSVRFSRSERVLLDHVSISYGIDESLDMYEAKDVTLQWSTIERASTTGHPEGVHAYGMINGPDGRRISVHHNLFAHNKNRNPAIANGPAEVINNVVYDVRHGFIHHNPAQGQFQIVGNTFVRGPASPLIPFYFDDESPGGTTYHLHDNAIDDPGNFVGVVDDPFTEDVHPSFDDLGIGGHPYAASPFDFSGQGDYLRPVAAEASSDAYARVVACAGAFPRDVVTRSTVDDLAARTGGWGANRPSDLMQGLTATAAPADADDDGIPDARETSMGLDPHDPHDAGLPGADGLSPLDRYLDDLADALTPCGEGAGGGGDDPGDPPDGGAGGAPNDGSGGGDATGAASGAGGADATGGSGPATGAGGADATGGSGPATGAGGDDSTGGSGPATGAGGDDSTGGSGPATGAGGDDSSGGSDPGSGAGGDDGGSIPWEDVHINCAVTAPGGGDAGGAAGLALLGAVACWRRRRAATSLR
jgi:pectate lyase